MRSLTKWTLLLALGFSAAAVDCAWAQGDEQVTVLTAEKAAADKATAAESGPPPKPLPKPVPPPAPPIPRRDDAGRLKADTMVFDFGEVSPKERVKGKFVLTNVGKEPLEIKKPIKPSCGCTVTSMKKYKLDPNESVVLEVTFTASSRPGRATKTIPVYTKAPAKPAKLILKITANVRKHIDSSPAKWEFELRDAPKNKVPVHLQSTDGKAFAVTRYTASEDAVKLTFDPKTKAQKHNLPIEVDQEKIARLRNGAVTIWTDHPKVDKITIPYKTNMPFAASKVTLTFGNVDPGMPQRSQVAIFSNYGQQFELGDFKSLHGFVQLENVTTRPEDGYLLDLVFQIPEDSVRKVARDTLTIAIKDHPQTPVKVQVYGTRRRAPTNAATTPPAPRGTAVRPKPRPRTSVPVQAPSQ